MLKLQYTCVCVCVTLLVTQLVCYSEGQWEPRVLADAAAAVWLTHPCHMRQTQSLTGHVDGCTDILPWKGRGGQSVKGIKERKMTEG